MEGDNAALDVDQLQGQTPPSEAEKVCQNSNEASCSVRAVTDSRQFLHIFLPKCYIMGCSRFSESSLFLHS